MNLTSLSSRRLTIAKELYLHGYSHSTRKSMSDLILSILNFDFCAETIVKTVLLDANKRLRRRGGGFKTFDELVSDLQSVFPNLRYISEIILLHKLRNDVQHQSLIPSEQEVSRHRTSVRLFFDDVCSIAYSGATSFDEISLALFLGSEIEKSILEYMEEAFDRAEYVDCVYYAKQAIVYHVMLLHSNMDVPHIWPFHFSDFFREIERSLEEINERVNWIVDRLCLREYYDDIRDLLGRISDIFSYKTFYLRREKASQIDAAKARNLAYNFMISTQDLVREPDLGRPYVFDLAMRKGDSENEYIVQVGSASVVPITEARLRIMSMPTKEETESGAKQQIRELGIPTEKGLQEIVVRELFKATKYSVSVEMHSEEGRDYSHLDYEAPNGE